MIALLVVVVGGAIFLLWAIRYVALEAAEWRDERELTAWLAAIRMSDREAEAIADLVLLDAELRGYA